MCGGPRDYFSARGIAAQLRRSQDDKLAHPVAVYL
jgi:hypothetical protein